MKRNIISVLAGLIVIGLLASVAGCAASGSELLPPQPRLKVATTTSLYDTGLWGYLEPMFEEKYKVEVDVLSLGSGAAFEYARRGDVDVITIHDKPNEEKFIAEGYGVERLPFAYNYFLIVGPAADPAGIRGLSAEDAFRELFETRSGSFISRGDNSGTHSKEKAIWQAAGYDYKTIQESDWAKSKDGGYKEAGAGMGQILMMASNEQAYTLTDMGTYLSYKGKLDLVPIVDRGSMLLNVYSVIAVNPEKLPKVNIEMADNLIAFLTSPEIQELIGNYGVEEYGLQLFIPCADAEPNE